MKYSITKGEICMTELEKKIQKAAQDYYTNGNSEYTDEEFDALIDQLKAENPDSELFKVGWGYKVSADTTPGVKRQHSYTVIGSLDKCHNLKELGKDFEGEWVNASTKLDGISIVLYYENGDLLYALTRGDGYVGVDVTAKILKIYPDLCKVNLVDDIPFTGAVRGEIVMSFERFENFKEVHPEAKNPRNSTAGIINGKDTDNDLTYLSIVLYTLVHDKNPTCSTIGATRSKIQELFDGKGPDTVKSVEVYLQPSYTDDTFISLMKSFKDDLYKEYPADGIVLTKVYVDDDLGTYKYTSKAFKFPAESKVTTITDIEWNMSKTKFAVPRILLEPIQLSGTTVSACTGFNAQYIRDNHLGPGSMVEVCKSGEIIPYILKVIGFTHEKLPEVCPECGQPLSWSGVHLVCTNENCCSSIEQDLLIWLKNLVPVDNLGDTLKLKFIRQMVDSNQLADCSIESVMNSKIHLEESTPSVQFNIFAKMWNKLHDSNAKFDLVHALMALNIPRIGDLTAIKFAQHPKELLKCLDESLNTRFNPAVVTDTYLILKDLIGDANARSVSNNLNKLSRLKFIENNIEWSIKDFIKSKGKVAITGILSVKRSDFEKELRQNGWEPTDNVNKDVKFLITDNASGQSSKNLKASKLGIPKVNEFEFRLKYLN